MVICPERGADLHMAQLLPLPLTDSLPLASGFYVFCMLVFCCAALVA